MAYKISYSASIKKDLRHISADAVDAILKAIRAKLITNPERAGKRLKGKLAGIYRMRVRIWRVLYTIRGYSVIVLRISHRKSAYRSLYTKRNK